MDGAQGEVVAAERRVAGDPDAVAEVHAEGAEVGFGEGRVSGRQADGGEARLVGERSGDGGGDLAGVGLRARLVRALTHRADRLDRGQQQESEDSDADQDVEEDEPVVAGRGQGSAEPAYEGVHVFTHARVPGRAKVRPTP
ncbi:hypothetical protein [Paenarthrobacter sp. C1]|uniref:hypothetical protein n=1 Tax=Paenarthrobacter sp. C1 TaxID=3400220 RepID=UPI003BF481D5